jgi:predicted TIM-barrel fold metal-dependent hydrolase
VAPARSFDPLEDLDALGLDDEARQLYLEVNARRVLALPDSST